MSAKLCLVEFTRPGSSMINFSKGGFHCNVNVYSGDHNSVHVVNVSMATHCAYNVCRALPFLLKVTTNKVTFIQRET
jgi:hypothetical protein